VFHPLSPPTLLAHHTVLRLAQESSFLLSLPVDVFYLVIDWLKNTSTKLRLSAARKMEQCPVHFPWMSFVVIHLVRKDPDIYKEGEAREESEQANGQWTTASDVFYNHSIGFMSS
jgi:hypothetical protein